METKITNAILPQKLDFPDYAELKQTKLRETAIELYNLIIELVKETHESKSSITFFFKKPHGFAAFKNFFIKSKSPMKLAIPQSVRNKRALANKTKSKDSNPALPTKSILSNTEKLMLDFIRKYNEIPTSTVEYQFDSPEKFISGFSLEQAFVLNELYDLLLESRLFDFSTDKKTYLNISWWGYKKKLFNISF